MRFRGAFWSNVSDMRSYYVLLLGQLVLRQWFELLLLSLGHPRSATSADYLLFVFEKKVFLWVQLALRCDEHVVALADVAVQDGLSAVYSFDVHITPPSVPTPRHSRWHQEKDSVAWRTQHLPSVRAVAYSRLPAIGC